MVKDFAANNKKKEIRRLLKVLGQDFATAQNAHSRKGGLIGLAAIAIALGKVSSSFVLNVNQSIYYILILLIVILLYVCIVLNSQSVEMVMAITYNSDILLVV